MGEVHPSIMNRLRQQRMSKEHERSILPAIPEQRAPETETATDETASSIRTKMGRIANLLSRTGEAGEY